MIDPRAFLNSLNPSELAPYTTKIDIRIISVGNLNSSTLRSVTKLKVESLRNNIIEATVLTGSVADR